MGAKFVIPKSTETGQESKLGDVSWSNLKNSDVQGNLSGILDGKFGLWDEKSNKGRKGQVGGVDKSNIRSLDLSYGYGNITNPLKKFHQTTMYFNDTKTYSRVEQADKTNYRPLSGSIITCNLPEQLSYKVGGSWSKPLDWTADAMLDLLVRTTSGEGRSLRTIASTGLMWTNTEPLEITFTIHAFDDTATGSGTNIQECLRTLGTYALPDEGDSVYRCVPSGVDLGLEIVTTKKTYHVGKTSANKNKPNEIPPVNKNLDVLFGGMLYLEKVSLKGFTVNYTNTKNMLLHHWNSSQAGQGSGQRLLPMTADITITLTTVRGLSRLNYTKMLMLSSDRYVEDKTITGQTGPEDIGGRIDLSGIGGIL